jgi:hypothetical protein
MPPAVRGLLHPALGRAALTNAEHALDHLHRAIEDRVALRDGGRLERLSRAETHEVLATQLVGRFVYVAREGVPDVVPVNYVWHEDTILIRSGPGPKLQAAERRETVAFEVDEVDETTHTGRSVVVLGRAEVLEPRAVRLDPEPWADGPRRHVIRIVPTRVEGRRLT